MKTTIELRADLLKTLMLEDRQEVRGIRTMVYNVVALLSAASFAISSFLLKEKSVPHLVAVSVVTDLLVVGLLWVFCLRLKRDLYVCRQCLVGRQHLIRNLGTDHDPADLDPWPNFHKVKPDVDDAELWWLPKLATAAILLKTVIIGCLQIF